jgi:Leucine-rich repeat (LRR) protein
VNDEWLHELAKIPCLRRLTLLGTDRSTATGQGVAALRDARELESLTLVGDWVQEEVFDGISNLEKLVSLEVRELETTEFSTGVFSHLEKLTELRELWLGSSKCIDDRGSESLKQLSKLQLLTLGWTNVSDETAAHLPALTQLVWLDLAGTKITGEAMPHLSQLPNLVRLSVRQTGVGDRGVTHVYALPRLRELLLDGTKITNDGLIGIEQLSDLEMLMLNQTAVDDSGLHHLYALKKLKVLSVGPNVSDAAVDELRKALPECEIHVMRPLPPTFFEESN